MTLIFPELFMHQHTSGIFNFFSPFFGWYNAGRDPCLEQWFYNVFYMHWIFFLSLWKDVHAHRPYPPAEVVTWYIKIERLKYMTRLYDTGSYQKKCNLFTRYVDFISKHFERMSSCSITASVFSYHATNTTVNSSVLKYSISKRTWAL